MTALLLDLRAKLVYHRVFQGLWNMCIVSDFMVVLVPKAFSVFEIIFSANILEYKLVTIGYETPERPVEKVVILRLLWQLGLFLDSNCNFFLTFLWEITDSWLLTRRAMSGKMF